MRSGILLVDKPAGITSHGIVAHVRRALGTPRVGHAGTLDPAATGLLIVGVGTGTRLLTFLVGLDKRYDATIRLGIATTTDDADGEVVARSGCRGDVDVAAGLDAFRGPLRQRPSSVSAVKVAGVPAHRRVRAGEAVELPARDVVVHDLAVRGIRLVAVHGVPAVDVDVTLHVSSGTYVRAIARDLGEALGVGGHLAALRRTAVGPFDVSAAVPLTAGRNAPTPDLASHLLPLGAVAAAVLPTNVVSGPDVAAVRHGTRLPCRTDGLRRAHAGAGGHLDGGPIALVDEAGHLLAVAVCGKGRWQYRLVVPDRSGTLEAPCPHPRCRS